ncbi:hypothetical protein ACIQUL_29540 [Streptomyces sp. NPDC090303]|uniref:hypothetical protein n=1 Tax=Streptomyces sp. NPDC090303 TaxID=3365960 RepID=UPI00380018D6
METTRIGELLSGVGDLAMACWTAMVPGDGLRSYALLAHCGTQETNAVMPSVAAVIGLDPTPGSVTSPLRRSTLFRMSENGWTTLCTPGGERIAYRAFDAWTTACGAGRCVGLYVSYLRLPEGVSVERHLKEMVRSDQYARGLVPVCRGSGP